MSVIASWLLSIAGIVILSVMAEFVLPEGQINKYVKVIFSFIILLTIILPLPKLFGKNGGFSEFLNQNETILQEDYLYQLNFDKLNTLTADLERRIDNQGLDKVEISLNANILSEQLEIFCVYVEMNSQDTKANRDRVMEIFKGYSILKEVEVRFDE